MNLGDHTVIYGGSFNPPHAAHQMACLHLLEMLGAGQVWLLPAAVHPFGKALAPFEHRMQMCQRLAAPFGKRVAVNPIESELQHSGRTYETLRALQSRHPGQAFALAVGADILDEVEKWHRWDAIAEMVPIVVIGRTGYDTHGEGQIALPRVSSSELRQKLIAGESIGGLLPTSVNRYIDEHNLYSQPPAPETHR